MLWRVWWLITQKVHHCTGTTDNSFTGNDADLYKWLQSQHHVLYESPMQIDPMFSFWHIWFLSTAYNILSLLIRSRKITVHLPNCQLFEEYHQVLRNFIGYQSLSRWSKGTSSNDDGFGFKWQWKFYAKISNDYLSFKQMFKGKINMRSLPHVECVSPLVELLRVYIKFTTQSRKLLSGSTFKNIFYGLWSHKLSNNVGLSLSRCISNEGQGISSHLVDSHSFTFS